MEKELGLYVCLCNDGTIKRTLRSTKGETELGDTTIGDALIAFSELNFENYAKILDVIKLYDEETEIAGAENFGQVDMDCFDQMKDLTNQLVSVLEEEIPVSGTLLRTMLEDNVPQDDGSAWYVYVAKSKIIDCLEAVMRFQMVLNHILSLLAQGGQVHPSDFPFLKEMSVTQIVRYDSTITTQYHFRAEAYYLKFLLMHFLSEKPRVGFCHCCGRFFIPKTKKKTLYCDRVLRDGKTCKELAPYLKHKRAARNETVIREFDRAKQRMYRRYERTDGIKAESGKDLTYSQYYAWLDAATEARDQFLRGEITESEALRIIIVP